MENTTAESVQVGDRVLLPFTFDPEKMLEDLKEMNLNNFNHYSVLPLRAPAHIIDPSRPFPPPADDYADGSWTEWLDSNELNRSSYIKGIVAFFKENTKVTLVRILRLEPGSFLAEHTDPTLGLEIEKSVVRLTIPIQRTEEMEFYLNGTTVPMKPGECWYMRLTDPHKVVNSTAEERINLTIDMIPNEWLRTIIEEAQ